MTLDPLVATGATRRWGVVGTGAVARKVTADLLLLPDARLTAVCARHLERAASFASEFGADTCADDVTDLLENDDVEVVYVATPHDSHAEIAAAAMRSGKHVLCEKPFTLNWTRARELNDIAAQTGRFLMEAMWTRFLPVFQLATSLIAGGRIGDPRRVVADIGTCVRYDPTERIWAAESGGGALLEMGPYPLTWATTVLGAPDQISASGTLAPNGVDAEFAVLARFADGAHAELSGSFLAHGPNEAVVAGTAGWLRAARPLHSSPELTIATAAGDISTVAVGKIGQGYVYELREVSACIQRGDLESPVLPLADTLATMRILDEIRAQLACTSG